MSHGPESASSQLQLLAQRPSFKEAPCLSSGAWMCSVIRRKGAGGRERGNIYIGAPTVKPHVELQDSN